MQKVIDVTENPIAMQEFGECLDMCRNCECLVSLKQFMQRSDAGFNRLEVDKEVLTSGNTVQVNGNFIYLSMTCENAIQLKRIKNIWKVYGERGHARYMEGKGNDYAMTLDLVYTEEKLGLAYALSFINPIFMGFDEGVLEMAFTIDSMNYEIASVDYVALTDAVEYEMLLDEEREQRPKTYNNTENEELVSNDDMLSNDDLLLVQE